MKKFALILAFGFVITGCHQEAVPAKNLEIQGRIAPAPSFQLEAGDSATVTVQDISIADKKAITLKQLVITDITSWPIDYNLTINSEQVQEHHSYSISVTINNKKNKLVAITDSNWSISAKKTQQDITVIPVASRNTSDQAPLSYSAVCDKATLKTSFGNGFAILYDEDKPVILKRTRSASGALYKSSNSQLWNKGDKATITLSGTELGECELESR